MVWLLGLGTLALMGVLAARANRRFAEHPSLPMQFGMDGRVGWTAPRAVALAFMPGLAVVTFAGLALLAPDAGGALVAALSLLGGQVFYHGMIRRHL